MAYTKASEIREIAGFTTSELSDSQLNTLSTIASIEVNNELNVKVDDELVYKIDSWRKNNVNGSNTVFYTRNYPLGDKDDDFSVGTSDVEAYTIDSDGNKNDYTPSSVDDKWGKVTLSSAPSGSETLYFTYEYLPVRITDDLIKEATKFNAAYRGVLRLRGRGIPKIKLGNVTTEEHEVGKTFLQEYKRLIDEIRRKEVFTIESGDVLEEVKDID